MSAKPRITPIEQQTTVQLGRDQVQRRVTSPMADAVAGLAGMAQAFGEMARDYQDAQAKYDNQLIQNWEEQLENKYKEMGGKLDQSQDPDQYDGIAKESLDDMKQTGKMFLGSKLYKKWEAEHGQNYYRSIDIDVNNKKQGLLHKKAFELAKDRVAEKARKIGYAKTEEERSNLLKETIADIESHNFSPLEEMALTKTLKTDATKSHLDYTVDTAPEKIATIDKDGKVTSIMDDPESYKDLTIAEKIAYKNKAITAQKARKKGEDEKMQPLYQWALTMSESDPEGLQRQVLLFRQDPYKFQQQIEQMLGVPVEAKKLGEMMNWTQNNLLDNPTTKAGQMKQENFAKVQTMYESFNIGQKDGKETIKNSELNNPGSLYEVISTMNSGLATSAFSKSDSEKVDGYRNKLTRQLGEKIKKADHANNWFWDASGDEMLQNEIALLSKSVDLSAEDAAFIYIEARKIAQRNNFDLSQDYDDDKEYAKNVEQIFSEARKEFFHKAYDIPKEHVDAAVYNGKLVNLQGQKKSERESYIKQVFSNAKQYQEYTDKGYKSRVKKDKDGRITSVYFVEGE